MKKKRFISNLWARFKSEPFYPFEIVDASRSPFEYKLLTKGELTPITLSAEEILSSNVIKRRIAPNTLLEIQRDLLNEQSKLKQYKIKEEDRRLNKYTLESANETLEILGEDFCKTPYLIYLTRPFDVFKIVSTTTFKNGCEFQEQIMREKLKQTEKEGKKNIESPLKLKIISNLKKI